MAKRNTNNRLYCAVYGCMNSSLSHPGIRFFRLPGDTERRLKWLQLIGREDLIPKANYTGYRLCEKHFYVVDVMQSSNRKILKKNALPLLMLPNASTTVSDGYLQEDRFTQTDLSLGVEICTQTERTTNEKHTQTTISLSDNSPRMRKLKAELLQCKKEIKQMKSEKTSKKAEEKAFHQLCDKFLSKKLALLIKKQSNLKEHGKGNRYGQDYIVYCLKLFCISPQAYRFLQSTLCLPCLSTLYKNSLKITSEMNEEDLNVVKMKLAQETEVEKEYSVEKSDSVL